MQNGLRAGDVHEKGRVAAPPLVEHLHDLTNVEGKELAQAAGLSMNALIFMAQGRMVPNLETAHRISVATGVAITKLFDLDALVEENPPTRWTRPKRPAKKQPHPETLPEDHKDLSDVKEKEAANA